MRPPSRTLLEVLYGDYPERLARLRRPKGVKGPGSWMEDPAGFERYFQAGDWRNPEGIPRRPPGSDDGAWPGEVFELARGTGLAAEAPAQAHGCERMHRVMLTVC